MGEELKRLTCIFQFICSRRIVNIYEKIYIISYIFDYVILF